MDRKTLYSVEDETASVMVPISTHSASQSSRGIARWLAIGAVSGPVLFTLVWLTLGFVSPGYTLWDIQVAPYSPISQPISGLGLGPTALYMNAAFITSGAMIMAGAVGIFRHIRELSSAARRSGTLLLGLTGLGMVLSGIFTLESILPHTAGFLLGNGTPVLSFLIFGFLFRRIPSWQRFGNLLLFGSPLTLALLVLFFMTFDPDAAGAGLGIAGLVQRILVTEVLAWTAAMGWRVFRHL